MAISIADFGSSVEEAQQKLGDLLPLLEHGIEKIKDLQSGGKMSDSGGGPFEIFHDLREKSMESSQVADHIHANCVKIDPDLDEVFVNGKKQLDEDLKLADEADNTFQSAQVTLDHELGEKTRRAAETFQTNLDNGQEKLTSLTTRMTSVDTSFTSAFNLVINGINEWTSQAGALNQELRVELDTLENDGLSTITQSGIAPLTIFEGTMSDMKEIVEAKMTEVRDELDGMLDALRADRRAVIWGFVEQYPVVLGQVFGRFVATADKVVGELESCKNNTLERLDTEIMAAQATSEKAKALLDDVTPKLSGVAEAKRTVETINQAM